MHEERRNTNMPARSKPVRKSERELVTTHTFDAPRELVWKTWTDPKLIPKWWGPSQYSTTVDKMDVRPGGRWRFVQRDAEGNEFGFHGADRELVIVRVFDAPRQRVWKAWTEPERLKRWWGPRTFTAPVAKIDLRVGGAFLYCMRQADGKDIWGTGVYREIVPLKRIVYTDSFADEKGNVVPATYYGMSRDFPLEMQVTVTFEDQDGKTKLTLHHVGIPAGPDRDGANQGWNESFDKLAEMLAT